jgi:hypothetical protein
MRGYNLPFAVTKRLWKAIEADQSPRTPSSTVKSPCLSSSLVGVEAGTCTEVTGTLELCFEQDGLVDACLGVYPGGAFWEPVAEGGLLFGAFVRFALGCFVFDPLDIALDVFDPIGDPVTLGLRI